MRVSFQVVVGSRDGRVERKMRKWLEEAGKGAVWKREYFPESGAVGSDVDC